MPATPLDVLISGDGNGGLCLAHGLRRAGISGAVYDATATAPMACTTTASGAARMAAEMLRYRGADEEKDAAGAAA